MKPYKNLSEVKRAANKVSSSTSQSDAFMYKCFPLLIETLLNIDNELHFIKISLEKETPANNSDEPIEKEFKEAK